MDMFGSIIKEITDNMTKCELQELVMSEKDDFTAGVKEIVENIKDGKLKTEIYDQLLGVCSNSIFIELLDEIVSSQIAPYEEMNFFRTLDPDTFLNLVKYMLENVVITCESKDTIEKKTNLDSDNVDYLTKLLYTVLEWIVVRRYTFERFNRQVFSMFRFDEEKSKILWNLFNEKKQELISVVMFENYMLCKHIKNDISQLIDIFTDLFEEDETD